MFYFVFFFLTFVFSRSWWINGIWATSRSDENFDETKENPIFFDWWYWQWHCIGLFVMTSLAIIDGINMSYTHALNFVTKKTNKIIRFVLCYKNLSQMFSSSLFAQSTSNGCFIMCCHLFVIFLKSLNLSSISAHHSLQCRAHVFSKNLDFARTKNNWKSIYNPPI